jgi:hypothetical protein
MTSEEFKSALREAGFAAPRDQRLKRRRQLPQIEGADIFSACAFRRLSLDGAMSRLTPAPTMRVHDPSGVATHGEALASAGQSAFRFERVGICFAAHPIGSLRYAAQRSARLYELPTSDARSPAG